MVVTEPLPIAPSRPERLEALTGVRALAAFGVVMYHFADVIYGLLPALRFTRPVVSQGFLGVDLFFVLSGFILSLNYLEQFAGGVKSRHWLHFIRLRLARIWPAHIFSLHVVVVMYFGAKLLGLTLVTADSIRYTFPAYLENITLTQAWLSGGRAPRLSWNGPAWTISAEWAAYLLFPFLAVGIARVRSLGQALVGVVGAYGVWLSIVTILLWNRPETSAISTAMVRIGTEFTAGCLLFVVYRKLPRRSTVPLATLAAVTTVLLTWFIHWKYGRGYVLTPLFGVLVLGLARDDAWLGGVLRRPTARFWGEISYSLYLMHQIVGIVLNKMIPFNRFAQQTLPLRLGVVAIYFLLTGVVSVLTYRLIERPGRQLLMRR